jgi:hypothetical protein
MFWTGHSWLYRFAAGCMSLATQHVFSTKRPTYSALLELDAKIRRFPIPRHLRCPMDNPAMPWSDDPHIAMQQFSQYGHVENSACTLRFPARRCLTGVPSHSLPAPLAFATTPRRVPARALRLGGVPQQRAADSPAREFVQPTSGPDGQDLVLVRAMLRRLCTYRGASAWAAADRTRICRTPSAR